MYDPRAVKIYIDGSALRNPGPGGLAGVIEYPEGADPAFKTVFKIGCFETTNNRMELLACIEALKYTRENARSMKASRVIIITDSVYVYGNQTRADSWRKQGCTNIHNRPVENSDLWKQFLSIRPKVSVRLEIVWKEGKTSEINKLVDREAKSAARNPTKKDLGFRRGKIARTSPGLRGAASLFPARGQECEIRVYKKLSAGKNEYKVTFELADLKGTVKHFAYIGIEKINELHRTHKYTARFNTDPYHPIILDVKPLD